MKGANAAVLGLSIACLCIVIDVAHSSAVINIESNLVFDKINPPFTESLVVSCMIEDTAAEPRVQFLSQLSILKDDTLLATIIPSTGAKLEVSDAKMSVNGTIESSSKLKPGEIANLELTVATPTASEAGVYKCKAKYLLLKTFQFKEEDESVTVTAEALTLEVLAKYTTQLKNDISSEVSTEITNIKEANKDLAKELAGTKDTNKQLTAQIIAIQQGYLGITTAITTIKSDVTAAKQIESGVVTCGWIGAKIISSVITSFAKPYAKKPVVMLSYNHILFTPISGLAIDMWMYLTDVTEAGFSVVCRDYFKRNIFLEVHWVSIPQ